MLVSTMLDSTKRGSAKTSKHSLYREVTGSNPVAGADLGRDGRKGAEAPFQGLDHCRPKRLPFGFVFKNILFWLIDPIFFIEAQLTLIYFKF